MKEKWIQYTLAAALMAPYFAFVNLSHAKAFDSQVPIRNVSVEETAGKTRANALVRIPITLDDEENVTDVRRLRVLSGTSELVYQPTDVVRYPSGNVKGANVYVADSFAAYGKKTYTVSLSDTLSAYGDGMSVVESVYELTVSGSGVGLTFYKEGGEYPGAIKAITTSAGPVTIASPGGAANAYAGPRAAIRLEQVVSRSLNDDFESGTDRPDHWRPALSTNGSQLSWDTAYYKHGGRSVKIANAGVSDVGQWESDKIAIAPNQRFYLEGFVRGQQIVKNGQAAGSGATMGFRFYDAAGDVVSEAYSTDSVSSDWTRVYTDVVNAPANAVRVSVFCSLKGSGAAWFDLLSLAQGDVAATSMANTPATQTNIGIAYETGPLFAKIGVVNQLTKAGVAANAVQRNEYLVPASGTAFMLMTEYGGDGANPDEGVEASAVMAFQGRLYLGGNDVPGNRNDTIVAYDIGMSGPSVSSGDLKKAVVDPVAQMSFIPVSFALDGITDVDYYGEELRVKGPNNLPVGLSKYYYHMYTHNRFFSTFVFSNEIGPAALNDIAIEHANPLVGIVDRIGASFDADLAPLLKQMNDLAIPLRADAWTMRALAAYVNYDLTGDAGYKQQADAIVAAGATEAMETVAYWEGQIAANALNVWALQALQTIGQYYNDWDRLWKIADALGQASINQLGFTDDHGYFHIASSFADKAARSAAMNMEIEKMLVYLWGHKMARNQAAYELLVGALSNPIYGNFVNAAELAYSTTVNGRYPDTMNSFQPHYSALTAATFKDVEYASDGRLSFAAPNSRLLYQNVDIDTGSKGEDATGWPAADRRQHHFWRLGFANFHFYNANLFLAWQNSANPTVGISALKTVFERYVELLNTNESSQNDRLQIPTIAEPDYSREFNLRGYYDAREYDPTMLVNSAVTMNKLYVKLKKELADNGDFERDPVNANGWETHSWGSAPTYAWDDSTTKSGFRSIRIEGVDVNAGINKNWTNNISVQPNRDYSLSVWTKTEGIAGDHGAWIWYEQLDANNNVLTGGRWDSGKMTGSNDWTRIERGLTTLPNAAKLRIYLHLRGSGSVWYDDLRLEEKAPLAGFQ